MSVQFETEDAGGITDAIASLHPIAVCSPLPLGERATAMISEAGVPLFDGEGVAGLGELHRDVGEAQVSHLASRGHRRIAFASTDVEKLSALSELRLDAVRGACRSRGLPSPPVQAFATDGTNAAGTVGTWHAEGITAVCAYNDETALVVLHGIRAAGLTCPADLAVIGIDAHPVGYVSEPPLTTVALDPQRLVQLSVQGLLEALGYSAAATTTDAPVVSVVQRGSV